MVETGFRRITPRVENSAAGACTDVSVYQKYRSIYRYQSVVSSNAVHPPPKVTRCVVVLAAEYERLPVRRSSLSSNFIGEAASHADAEQ